MAPAFGCRISWPVVQQFVSCQISISVRFPSGVDDEVGDTPLGTIKTAQTIGRRRNPQSPSERGLGDAWILVAFIIVVGLIFVVATWVFAGHR
jgi:hypothetical protein